MRNLGLFDPHDYKVRVSFFKLLLIVVFPASCGNGIWMMPGGNSTHRVYVSTDRVSRGCKLGQLFFREMVFKKAVGEIFCRIKQIQTGEERIPNYRFSADSSSSLFSTKKAAMRSGELKLMVSSPNFCATQWEQCRTRPRSSLCFR